MSRFDNIDPNKPASVKQLYALNMAGRLRLVPADEATQPLVHGDVSPALDELMRDRDKSQAQDKRSRFEAQYT